ncbi:MAG: trigger factor [Chloroflexi bacterium]|nr:trigger factor [Chloroflexota bacterium]
MQVIREELPDSQIVLEITVEDERLEQAKAAAYRRVASKAKIPGFRPGKAPREVVERHFGAQTFLHEAIDKLMSEVYQEALEQEQIDPIEQASFEVVTEEPLVAKFTVPVRPTIDLAEQLATLRVPRETVEVDAERVDEGLESLRHRYATLEPVDRPTKWDDIVRADVNATVNSAPLFQDEDAEFQLVKDRTISLPGFAEALIGRKKGEEFQFSVTVPDDAPNEKMRGEQAQYQVHLKELKEEILPELDDEFARGVGEGFESLEALRTRVENDLREALEQEEEQRYKDEVLETLTDEVQPQFPPILSERETERMLKEQLGAAQRGRRGGNEKENLEGYLQQIGKSEDELMAEMRPLAEARIRRSLVLSEVGEAEHIEVGDDEVDTEIERLTSGVGDQADELRRLFSQEAAKENLRRSLTTKKTLDRLVEIASSDGAEPADEQEEAQASASRNG